MKRETPDHAFAEAVKSALPGVTVTEDRDSSGRQVFRLDPGQHVYCDGCSEDWTDRPESGGLYGFGTKAYCPTCAVRMEESAKKYGEESAIKARCPAGKSFADWVREDLR